MGHIIKPAFAFRASLSEDAGVRSGFSLTERELFDHLPVDHPLRRDLAQDIALRVDSETYADTVGDLLYALGAAEDPGMPTLAERLIKYLDRDWRELFGIDEILQLEAVANHYLRLRNGAVCEEDKIYTELSAMFGRRVSLIIQPLRQAMAVHLAHCPFFTREAEKVDLITLATLFESENLPMEENHFFDQRFINYLAAHPDRLGDMNWRQFEGMAAEWFLRQGYEVELGPGRNDGSIDLRA